VLFEFDPKRTLLGRVVFFFVFLSFLCREFFLFFSFFMVYHVVMTFHGSPCAFLFCVSRGVEWNTLEVGTDLLEGFLSAIQR